jgi:hypothetical protein
MSCDPRSINSRLIFDQFIISGILPSKSDQLIQAIAGTIYHDLLNFKALDQYSKKDTENTVSKIKEDVLADYKRWFEERKTRYEGAINELNKPESSEKFTTEELEKRKFAVNALIQHIDSYLNEWSKVERMTDEFFTTRTGITEIDDISDMLDDTDATQERTSYEDDYTFLMDNRKGASSRMKLLFSFIPKGKIYLNKIAGLKTENPNKNNTYYPIDEVFNTVTEILASGPDKLVDFDWDSVKQTLLDAAVRYGEVKRNSEKADFIKKLTDVLDVQPQHIKNEFMMVMMKHYSPMKMIHFDRNEVRLVDADAYTVEKNIVKSWYEAMKLSDLIDEDGFFIREKIKQVVAKITELQNNYTNKEFTPIQKFFDEIGLNLPLEVWEHIGEKGLPHQKTTYNAASIFGSGPSSMLGILKSKLNATIQDEKVTANIDDLNPFDESIFRSLAKLQAMVSSGGYAQSARVADKTIFPFTNFKYSIQRLLNLKFKPKARKELSETAFAGKSLWLRLLESEEFKKKFEYAYVSLEAIRKLKGKASSSKALERLSAIDHELYKVGAYFNQGVTSAKDRYRHAWYMYFTMSDKKTQKLISSLAFDIREDKISVPKIITEDNIIYESVDLYEFLVDTLVIPEIDRMERHFSEDLNISGYDPNLFYVIPELNYGLIEDPTLSEAIWGKDGNIRPLDIRKEGSPAREAAKEIVKRRVQKEIENKKQEWKKAGIGLVKGKFQYLDKSAVSRFSSRFPSTEKNRLQSIQDAMVEDYVINQMIANMNIAQLFTGDPAIYSKPHKTKPTDSLSNKVIAKVLGALENMGKRLAMDNSPRYIGLWKKQSYTQGFIEDARMVSDYLEELVKILDQKELDPELKLGLLSINPNEVKQSKEKFVKEYPISAPYIDITSTDAQEFTTLAEHIEVMYAYGKLNDAQYEGITDAIRKGRKLNDGELSLVLQPIKPLYGGHLVENGLDRRMYIKTSSFPLIKQLTAGLEIDKLRVAMERDGVDRVVHSSGIKVGNVASPLRIYNSDGTLKDDISFKSKEGESAVTKTLNRADFGLQLEVPYDPEKNHVNTGTQERKLLFNNILNVVGFLFKGERLTGKQLKKKYLALWEEAYRTSQEELLDELGGSIHDVDYKKLLQIAIKEAKERNYSINDIIGLHPRLDEKGNFVDVTVPVWALPSSTRIEALMVSIVEARVLRKLYTGKSYVLGTEQGFKSKPQTLESLSEKDKSGIIYTSEWKGQLKSNEVLVPWKFKHKIENFLTEDGKSIDTTKLPSELLEIFGFRIPTQGFNSMRSIKIVGFLPKESGDLVIASKDLVVQMGSDFDVDKLYTYMYNVSPVYKTARDKEKITQLKNQKKLKTKEDVEAFINFIKENVATEEVRERLITFLNSLDTTSTRKFVQSTFKGFHDKGFGKFAPGSAELKAVKETKAVFVEYVKTIKEELDEFDEIIGLEKYTGDDVWKRIQNDLLEIHHTILNNESPLVQHLVNKPLDYGNLESLATKINAIRNSTMRDLPSMVSPDYQKSKYLNARAGKIGIGSFSLDSVFASIIQGTAIRVNPEVFREFSLGMSTANLDITSPYTNKTIAKLRRVYNEKYTSQGSFEVWLERLNIDTLIKNGDIKFSDIKHKTEVIAAYQSSSVDDEKQQILAKLNIQSETFDAIRGLAFLGFEENEIHAIISQDFMFDLVNRIREKSSSIEEYSRDVHEKALDEIIKDRMDIAGVTMTFEEFMDDATFPWSLVTGDIEKLLVKSGNLVEKDPIQSALEDLVLIAIYKQTRILGLDLRSLQSLINTDSAGLQQSFIATSLKHNQISKLHEQGENSLLLNKLSILIERTPNEKFVESDEDDGSFPPETEDMFDTTHSSINGIAIEYGLQFANNLFLDALNMFPYNSSVIRDIINDISKQVFGYYSWNMSKRVEFFNKVFKEFKSYLFSNTSTGLFQNLEAERRILHFPTEKNTTLAQKVLAIQRGKLKFGDKVYELIDSSIKDNAFIKRLEPKINRNKNSYSLVELNAAAATNIDERSIHIAVADLVNNPKVIFEADSRSYTTKDLVDDLIKSAYITGGIQEARQYIRYLPIEYVLEKGLGKYLLELNFDAPDNWIKDKRGKFSFIKQFFQHNPDSAYNLDIKDIKFNTPIGENNVIDWKKVMSAENTVVKLAEELPDDVRFFSIRLPREVSQRSKIDPRRDDYLLTPETGYLLFEKVDGKVFARIQTLGDGNISEYNSTTDSTESLLEGNKSNIVELLPVDMPVDRPDDLSTALDWVDEMTTVQNALQHIINNSPNSDHIELSELLIEALDNIERTAKIKFEFNTGETQTNALGRNTYTLNSQSGSLVKDLITVDKKRILETYKHYGYNTPNEQFNEILIHESLHAVTAYILYSYREYPDTLSPSLRKKIKALDELRLNSLKELDEIYLGLSDKKSFAELFDTIIKGPFEQRHFDVHKHHFVNSNVRNEEDFNIAIKLYYKTSNIDEYIAGISQSTHFKSFLIEQDKTIIEKIIDFLQEVLETLSGRNTNVYKLNRDIIRNIIETTSNNETIRHENFKAKNGQVYLIGFTEFDNITTVLDQNTQLYIYHTSRNDIAREYRESKENPLPPDPPLPPVEPAPPPVEKEADKYSTDAKKIVSKIKLANGKELSNVELQMIYVPYLHAYNLGYLKDGDNVHIIHLDTGIEIFNFKEDPKRGINKGIEELVELVKSDSNYIVNLITEKPKVNKGTVKDSTPIETETPSDIVVPEGSSPNNPVAFESNGVKYLMNDDQAHAYNTILNFIYDRVRKRQETGTERVTFTDRISSRFSGMIAKEAWDNMLGLLGKAGTGKTTITKRIYEQLKLGLDPNNFFGPGISVVFIGPTHTACTVTAESLDLDSEGTGAVPTAASLVNSLPNKDDSWELTPEGTYIGQIKFGNRTPISARDVIILDESSMYNAAFLKSIEIRLQQEKKNNVGSGKWPVMIFLGDYRQIPEIRNTPTPYNESIIPATVFKEKYVEMHKIMRTEDPNMYEIFDAVADQIDATRDQFNHTGTYAPFDWKLYDQASNKSSKNVLVISETIIDKIIEAYANKLAMTNDPYEIFWIHYNRREHKETSTLAEKIRRSYLKRIGKEYSPNIVEGDYVEYGLNIPFTTNLSQRYLWNNAPVEYGTIKPRARIKILKIHEEIDISLRELDLSFNETALANVNVRVKPIIFQNRQGKIRLLYVPVQKFIDSVEYDSLSKDAVFKLFNGSTIRVKYAKGGKQLMDTINHINKPFEGEVKVNKQTQDVQTNSWFTTSYIGSSHTAQGNSIKNVIVGDYNIRKNARGTGPLSNQVDIMKSLYTALTRASKKLIIIKPAGTELVDNTAEFSFDDKSSGVYQEYKKEKSLFERQLENYINAGVKTLWLDYESNSSGRRIRKLENVKFEPGIKGKFFANQDGDYTKTNEFNIERIKGIYEKDPQPKAPVAKNKPGLVKATIPQNFVHGIQNFGSLQYARPEILKEWKEENPITSIDMIRLGYRTRTTRSADKMLQYNIKVGDIVEMTGLNHKKEKKSVLVKVTAIYGKEDTRFQDNWKKEGWTDEGFSHISRYSEGVQAIEFELYVETEGFISPKDLFSIGLPVNKSNVKPGVSELFESNPELANAVYEALGFDIKQDSGLPELGDIFDNYNEYTPYREDKLNQASIDKLKIIADTLDKFSDKELFNLITDNLKENYDENSKFLSGRSFEAWLGDIKVKSIRNDVQEYKEGNRFKGKDVLLSIIGTDFSDYIALITPERNTKQKEQITPQQKQQALQLYSQYLDTILNSGDVIVKDVEGFKGFINAFTPDDSTLPVPFDNFGNQTSPYSDVIIAEDPIFYDLTELRKIGVESFKKGLYSNQLGISYERQLDRLNRIGVGSIMDEMLFKGSIIQNKKTKVLYIVDDIYVPNRRGEEYLNYLEDGLNPNIFQAIDITPIQIIGNKVVLGNIDKFPPEFAINEQDFSEDFILIGETTPRKSESKVSENFKLDQYNWIQRVSKGILTAYNEVDANAIYQREVSIHGVDRVTKPLQIKEGVWRINTLVHANPKVTENNFNKWWNNLSPNERLIQELLIEQQIEDLQTIKVIPSESVTVKTPEEVINSLENYNASAVDVIRSYLINRGAMDIHNSILDMDLFEELVGQLEAYIESVYNIRGMQLFSMRAEMHEHFTVNKVTPNMELITLIDTQNNKYTPTENEIIDYSPALTPAKEKVSKTYKNIKSVMAGESAEIKYDEIARRMKQLWEKNQSTEARLAIEIGSIQKQLSKLPQNHPDRPSLYKRQNELHSKLINTRQESTELLEEVAEVMKAVKYEEVISVGKTQLQRLQALLSKDSLSDEEMVYINNMINLWNEIFYMKGKGILFELDEISSLIVREEILQLKSDFDLAAMKYDEFAAKKVEQFVNEQLDLSQPLTEEEIFNSIQEISQIAAYTRDIGKFNAVHLQAMSKLIAKVYAISMSEAQQRNNEMNELLKKALPKIEKLGGWDIFLQRVKDSKGNSYRTGRMVFWYKQEYYEAMKKAKENLTKKVEAIRGSKTIPENEKTSRIREEWKKYHKNISKNTEVFDIRKLEYDRDLMPEVEVNGQMTREVYTPQEIQDYEDHLRKVLGDKNYERLRQHLKFKKEKFLFELDQVKRNIGSPVPAGMSLADAQSKYFHAEKTSEGIIGFTKDEYDTVKEWEALNSPYYKSQFLSDPQKIPIQINGIGIIPNDNFMVSAPRKYDPKTGDETGIYDPQMETIEGDEDLIALYEYIFDTLAELKDYLPGYMLDGKSITDIPYLNKEFVEVLQSTPALKKFSAALSVMQNSLRSEIDEEKQTKKELRIARANFLRNNKKEIEHEVNLRIERIIFENAKEGKPPLTQRERAIIYNDLKKQVTDEIFTQNQSQDLGKVIKWYTAMVLLYQEKGRFLDSLSVVENYLKNLKENKKIEKENSSIFKKAWEKIKTNYNVYVNKPKVKKPGEQHIPDLTNLITAVESYMDIFEGQNKDTSKDFKITAKRQDKVNPYVFPWLENLRNANPIRFMVMNKKDRKDYKDVVNMINETKQLLANNQITPEEYSARMTRLNALKERYDKIALSTVGLADGLLMYTQLLLLGWNFKSFFPNRMIGIFQNLGKAADNRAFSIDDYGKAFRIASTSKYKLQFIPAITAGIAGGIFISPFFGSVLAYIGGHIAGKALYNLVKSTNKQSIKIENFITELDILKKQQDELRKTSKNRKRGGRLKEEISDAYAIMQAAEQLNQSEILIALMHAEKLEDKNGKLRPLWEAFNENLSWNSNEFDDNPDWNFKKYGIRNTKKMLDLKLEVDHIITMVHGNYDLNKPILIKRKVWGRLVSQFRTWFYENMSQFTEGDIRDYLQKNRLTGEEFVDRRGRLQTMFSMNQGGVLLFISQYLKGMIALNKIDANAMQSQDVANIRALVVSTRMYLTTIILYLTLKMAADDEKDKEKLKAYRIAINMFKRFKDDMDLYYTFFLKGDYKKVVKNVENILPVLVTIDRIGKFISGTWDTIMGDPYKGKGKNKKLKMFDSGAKLVPYGGQALGTIEQAKKEFN